MTIELSTRTAAVVVCALAIAGQTYVALSGLEKLMVETKQGEASTAYLASGNLMGHASDEAAPDLIETDIVLSGEDALWFLEQLRRPATPHPELVRLFSQKA